MVRNGEIKDRSAEELAASYRKGINKGLYKIMSKMGIATIASYRGSQLFEIVGLHDEIVEQCFQGAVSRIQGARCRISEKATSRQLAMQTPVLRGRTPIAQGGLYKYIHGGEYHAYHPDIIQTLHLAVRSGEYEDYKVFADLVNHRPVATLRDLLRPSAKNAAIAIEDVEPIETILKRFDGDLAAFFADGRSRSRRTTSASISPGRRARRSSYSPGLPPGARSMVR